MKRISLSVILSLNLPLISYYLGIPAAVAFLFYMIVVGGFTVILVSADGKHGETRRTMALWHGTVLLRTFVLTMTLQAVIVFGMMLTGKLQSLFRNALGICIWWGVWIFLLEAGIFWAGMVRIYLTSQQLGIRWRVLGLLCGWIFPLNLVMLHRLIRVVTDEADFEDERIRLDQQRAESQICHTKYPILMVHGVFFRDFRYLNYWGRMDQQMPDQAGIFYQSVMSYVEHAAGGRFPLNLAYPLVKYFDGENDGLVSVESGVRWANPIRLAPPKKRGITHADMIDLNRENIDGFDVREFYVQLVQNLKSNGF